MSTPFELFDLITKGNAGELAALLEREPDLAGARNEQGDSVLLAAIYNGRGEIVDSLLDRGAKPDLFEASALGRIDLVRAILDQDPSRVRAYSHDGWTALHLAAFFGRADVARELLARGAEVNALSRSERFAKTNTPLHAAAANKQNGVATLLVEHGADFNAKDGSGFTPLGLAANNHNDLLVIHLLELGAQV